MRHVKNDFAGEKSGNIFFKLEAAFLAAAVAPQRSMKSHSFSLLVLAPVERINDFVADSLLESTATEKTMRLYTHK